MKNEVWAAMHNPMTWESADTVLSLHKTRKGAEKAIKDHEKLKKEKYLDTHGDIGDYDNDFSWENHKENFLNWNVKKMEIKD